MFRNILRSALACFVYGLTWALKKKSGKLLILTYHRVLPDTGENLMQLQPGMYVKESSFEKHLKFLKEKYTVIGIDEVLKSFSDNQLDLNGNYCVLTFDDGWIDNYLHAYPLLKKYNLPATIFLPTDCLDGGFCFWIDQVLHVVAGLKRDGSKLDEFYQLVDESIGSSAFFKRYFDSPADFDWGGFLEESATFLKRLERCERDRLLMALTTAFGDQLPTDRQLIDWDMAREMSASNISFGSHSCGHVILTECSPSELSAELCGSWDRLKAEGVNFVPALCFPNGDFNDVVIESAVSAGYEVCLTTVGGENDMSALDRCRLKRISIHEDVSANRLLLNLHLFRRAS